MHRALTDGDLSVVEERGHVVPAVAHHRHLPFEACRPGDRNSGLGGAGDRSIEEGPLRAVQSKAAWKYGFW